MVEEDRPQPEDRHRDRAAQHRAVDVEEAKREHRHRGGERLALGQKTLRQGAADEQRQDDTHLRDEVRGPGGALRGVVENIGQKAGQRAMAQKRRLPVLPGGEGLERFGPKVRDDLRRDDDPATRQGQDRQPKQGAVGVGPCGLGAQRRGRRCLGERWGSL